MFLSEGIIFFHCCWWFSFVLSSFVGHLGFFQLLVIVNNTATNIHNNLVHVFLWSKVVISSWNTEICSYRMCVRMCDYNHFPNCMYQFTIPSEMCESSIAPYPHQHLITVHVGFVNNIKKCMSCIILVIPVGCNVSLWFQFAFLWWLMMLNIFSYAYYSFAYHFWWCSLSSFVHFKN